MAQAVVRFPDLVPCPQATPSFIARMMLDYIPHVIFWWSVFLIDSEL